MIHADFAGAPGPLVGHQGHCQLVPVVVELNLGTYRESTWHGPRWAGMPELATPDDSASIPAGPASEPLPAASLFSQLALRGTSI